MGLKPQTPPFRHPTRTKFKTLNKVILPLRHNRENFASPLSSCAVHRLKIRALRIPCTVLIAAERARDRSPGIRPAWNNRERHIHVKKMHAPDGVARARSGPERFGFRKLGLGSIS
ncbi:hypothetical protein ES288_D11G050400v1 [Gossypium darwinii]|uniref:Uncharacterized protein n=1 Tax=Gossypium darwinii TaxID=34276 RepID=A0A5D2AHJ5_GOSDA|nr:hypothetical protein ES288_D11G050400v1 [Gossypium darwinii]